MNKAICNKCQIEQELRIWLNSQNKLQRGVFASKSKKYIEIRVRERIETMNLMFKEMGIKDQPCPIAMKNEDVTPFDEKMVVKEPPENCPYILEHTVSGK